MKMSKVLVANPPEKKCRALFAFVNFVTKLVKKVMSLFISVDNGGSCVGEHRSLQYSLFCILAEMWNFHKHLLSFSLLLNNFYF